MYCTIEISALKAALIFAAKKDVRYYLNGVCIEWGKLGTRLIATDGHRAFVCQVDTESNDPAHVIVPTDSIAAVLKLSGKLRAVECNYAEGKVSFTGGITATPIDGRFPEIDRVIPTEFSGEVAQFDFEYLGDIGKALKCFGKQAVGTLRHNGRSAGRVDLTETAFAILMPIRT